MKKIGIIGAMEIEINDIVKKMESVNIVTCAGQKFYIGNINGNKSTIFVTCSGIGKVCASISTQILISEFKVECVINTGIAGSMSNSLKIGDIVISKTLQYHDFDKELLKDYYPFKTEFTADSTLINLAKNAITEFSSENINYKEGLIITGDIFLEDKNVKEKLKEKFSPLCIEMEGCAIAHCCCKNNIPFVIIRSISDTADSEMVYEQFKKTVAKLSSSIVINMVNNI